ncbi:MAG: ATP-binding protein [Treponema sp.]|nr:ATP-binding protein [Treponema sp.]
MKRIKLFSGIKAKTTLFTIIPVIIAYFTVSSVLFISLSNSQQNMTISEFKNITSRYTVDFERKINNALDYLSSVTSILEFQVYEGATDREALHRVMYFIFDGHTVDSSSIYFEPDMYDGKDALYVNTEYGSALSGRISYYFYRYNGRTGYRQSAMDNDIEFTMPLYVDTKRLNAPTYTKPEIYEIDGVDTLKFVITYPISSRDGEFIGVITADIFLQDMYTKLQAEKIYETGYIIIANDKEQIIYSPRFEDIGKTRKEAGLSYPLPPNDITSEVFNAESIINNEKTLISIQSVYFPQFDSRFYISVAAPVKEINASGARLLFFIVIFSITIIILIALFLYYLISRLMNPLVEFTESADKMAYGDFNTRITGVYKDEFGLLKDTVNLMAERVKNTLSVLQNILNGIDAFVFVTNPKTGEILFINEQMKEGYNIKDDIIGQYCYKIFQEDMDKMCEFCPCHLLDINPDKPVLWETYCTITKRFYHNTDCYIEWIGGTKVHLQHSVDITDLKTITEEKFKAEKDALELSREKDHAEETSRMKSVFLANMSHEIRTPMNAILGVTELLFQNERLPADIEEGLDKIYSSCDMLLGIINDILDFSKIEAGKLDIIPVKYKISSLINDSVNLNMMRIDTKPIGFELQIDENIPVTLIGDELRIKQILNNLLSNAIKYTDAGKVSLSIEFENDPAASDQIILVLGVSDTGQGMTDEQMGQMFDEYSRFNQEANMTVEGTGLGLAITQRLINLMNGNMQVQSKVNKGSTFTVRLPQKITDNEILGKELADNLMHFRVNYMINRKEAKLYASQCLMEISW